MKVDRGILEEKEPNLNIGNTPENIINETSFYVSENPIFKAFSTIVYYGIAYPILTIILKIVFDLKIEGKENIKDIGAGAITVSNHVLILDCAMVGIACGKRKVYFTTREESFQIPFVRKLIKVLNAIPIPKKMSNKKQFIEEIGKLLKRGEIVHFYPEGSLEPYHIKIRRLKEGCFDLAIKNEVPIIPMVFTFREPKGIRKLIKRKKDVTLTIGKSIWGEEGETKGERVEKLKRNVQEEMEKMVQEKMYKVYMLRCQDNSLYTGITTDLERRMKEHFERTEKCAKYTSRHIAQKLECAWQCENRAIASKLEYYIKKLSKKQKETLVQSNALEAILGEKLDCTPYIKIR